MNFLLGRNWFSANLWLLPTDKYTNSQHIICIQCYALIHFSFIAKMKNPNKDNRSRSPLLSNWYMGKEGVSVLDIVQCPHFWCNWMIMHCHDRLLITMDYRKITNSSCPNDQTTVKAGKRQQDIQNWFIKSLNNWNILKLLSPVRWSLFNVHRRSFEFVRLTDPEWNCYFAGKRNPQMDPYSMRHWVSARPKTGRKKYFTQISDTQPTTYI